MFDDKPEPDTFIQDFIKDIKDLMKKDGMTYVDVDFGDDINAYYDVLLRMEEFDKHNLKIHMTSKDQPEIIIEHENIELSVDAPKNSSMRRPTKSAG